MANQDREQASRDTQFSGFANAVLERMFAVRGGYIDTANDGMDEEINAQYRLILVQCAYDLVFHTIEYTSCHDLDVLNTEEHVLRIPDMPELPEEA